MKLWQLKNSKTGENLSEPQPLPENWGPIFGLSNVKERLGDLSWVGINDKCWVQVEVEDKKSDFDIKSFIDNQIEHMLKESLPMVAEDNLTITKGDRVRWLDYRRQLKEIYLQPDYPTTVYWPSKPE